MAQCRGRSPRAQAPLKLTQTTIAPGKTVNKVVSWGNPNVGFVGNVYKSGYGYGIDYGPMLKLSNEVFPGHAVNLTHQPFSAMLAHVSGDVPGEVGMTLTFKPANDWVVWNSPPGPVHAAPLEHAVIIVGYSPHYLYINNPWRKSVQSLFHCCLEPQLEDRAVSVKASAYFVSRAMTTEEHRKMGEGVRRLTVREI
ncbi:MAG: hypothetical protein C7B43_18930 [Sulfobacillus benefaciens]|uniref:Peptidase C39-like domain-containing protein n=1 Tax=Sulfobacillus benefaciens TaxID=453960 RepID=A0A2T2WQI3_9FIRM|nr:MAG: hypothetical protein C7B43_18930 [Sulfobacillus benefaciens]